MTITDPETKTPDGLDTDNLHGFCEECYPIFTTGGSRDRAPAFMEAVCGAMVLTSTIPDALPGEDPCDIPANACPRCVEATVCSKGHGQ